MRTMGTVADSKWRTPTGGPLPALRWVPSAGLLVSTWAATPSRARPPAGAQAADSGRDQPAAEGKAAAAPAAGKVDDEAAARAEAIRTATPILRTIIRAELPFIRVASGASDD